MSKALIPIEIIENRIFLIRGQKVMIDKDLAELYGVKTKGLNRQVRRNIDRFPSDFMFKLTQKELEQLVPIWHQFKTRKHSYILPLVFTEQGIAMLSSVLRSKRAVYVNIQIMRAFVNLRKILSSHAKLRKKIEQIEKKYDGQFKVVFDAIKKLMEEPAKKSNKNIGFLK